MQEIVIRKNFGNCLKYQPISLPNNLATTLTGAAFAAKSTKFDPAQLRDGETEKVQSLAGFESLAKAAKGVWHDSAR